MIPKGTLTVACRECEEVGVLQVGRQLASGKVKVTDHILHKETCTQYVRPQPKHLKSRGTVRKQESRANSLVGARPTAASGALGMDGDGRAYGRWRVEAKQTKAEYYSVSQKVWSKVVGGLRVGEEPLLHVEIRDRIPHVRVCIVRRELLSAWAYSEAIDPPENKWVGRDTQPKRLLLEPEAVAISEEIFSALREANES